MSELGKPFRKKLDHKNKKQQKINVKMPHVNQKTIGEIEIWFEQKIRTRMNYEWIGKTNLKKIRSNKSKKQ